LQEFLSLLKNLITAAFLFELIDNTLGIKTLSGYQYNDIIRGWLSVFFSGGNITIPLVARNKGIDNRVQNQAGRNTDSTSIMG
jgi:hypothetical protein